MVDAEATINAMLLQQSTRPGNAHLPQAQSCPSPLLTLAVATSAGVTLAHYFQSQSITTLIVALVIDAALTSFAIVFLIRNMTSPGSIFLIAAFLCAGFVLSQIENRPAALSRIPRM